MSALAIERKIPKAHVTLAKNIPVGGVFYEGDRTYMRLCRGSLNAVFGPEQPAGTDIVCAVDLHTGKMAVFSGTFAVGVIENAMLSYAVKP